MSRVLRLGVVMDPIGAIHVHKDSTLAMLLAAQRRGWPLHYMERTDLYLRDGRCHARMRALEVHDDPRDWYRLEAPRDAPLAELDLVLMRLDPPYTLNYHYTAILLERAAAEGVTVVNRPDSLRLINEKLFTAWFPELCPPTLVSAERARLRAFLEEQGDIVVKPLDAMGGAGVFRLRRGDPNVSTVLEVMTAGHTPVMAQRFLPEIQDGDKRILLIDGEPVPYALARIPAEGELRGNLAAGGRGVARPLGARDREIAARVGPELVRRGVFFAGLDVIGDHLTEINVTSPTCIRELDAQCGLDIAGALLDALQAKLAAT
ncbi:MAG: glutathione synthetase [Gammaproteobacteria bacterium]|nr:MAG: glutathione synthetase [Gammaproteobacteria bacterium]